MTLPRPPPPARAASDEAWLDAADDIRRRRDVLVAGLRSGDVRSASQAALATCALLERVAAAEDWRTAAVLLRRLRRVGGGVVRAAPGALSVGNVLRRALLVVREEYARNLRESTSIKDDAGLQRSLGDVLAARSAPDALADRDDRRDVELEALRDDVLDQLRDLADEIANAREAVAARAPGLVAPGAVVLTAGRSRSVAAFLRRAAPAEVVVVDEDGRAAAALAKALPAAAVTRVTAAAAMAVAGRCRCAVLGCSAALADGGIIAQPGARLVAEACAALRKPVLALCALYKLAPLHHPGAAAARAAVAADLPLAAALPFGALPCDAGADPLAAPAPAVRHPRADAVPPDLVDLLVTNAGVHAPSYAPRLLAEMYAPEDHDLLRAEL